MNLKGKRIEVLRAVRGGNVRRVYEIAAWSFMQAGSGASGSFALLVIDVETLEIEQLAVNEAGIKIVPGPEPAARERFIDGIGDAIKGGAMDRAADQFRQMNANISRAMGNNAQCDAVSSVTGLQCVLSDGHPADDPTRFHRFPKPQPGEPPPITWSDFPAAMRDRVVPVNVNGVTRMRHVTEHAGITSVQLEAEDVEQLRRSGVHVVEANEGDPADCRRCGNVHAPIEGCPEANDAIGSPTPDLAGALAHTAAERDTALARIADLERARTAIQNDANKALEAKREAVAQYERITAEADRKLAELRRMIATLTKVPTFMPSLTEGTEERDCRLYYKGDGRFPGDEVSVDDGTAYKEWAARLVAERNEARRCCLELQARIDAFTATEFRAERGDRFTS